MMHVEGHNNEINVRGWPSQLMNTEKCAYRSREIKMILYCSFYAQSYLFNNTYHLANYGGSEQFVHGSDNCTFLNDLPCLPTRALAGVASRGKIQKKQKFFTLM